MKQKMKWTKINCKESKTSEDKQKLKMKNEWKTRDSYQQLEPKRP